MTAFQATYSDWKLIRTRKVVQIVLEVPIEAADHAYKVLGGMPNPASEIWVGVARFKPGTEVMPRNDAGTTQKSIGSNETTAASFSDRSRSVKPPAAESDSQPRARKSFTSLPLPQQAALLCQDAVFRTFVRNEWHQPCDSESRAADALYRRYNIKSRSELKTNTFAAEKFSQDRDKFIAWKFVT